jgi:hypothetical protein
MLATCLHYRHLSAIILDILFSIHPSFSLRVRIYAMEMACLLSSCMIVNSALFVIVSDISSDIPYEKSVASATIVLPETIIRYNGGTMAKLSETELKKLIRSGERNTVELKLAAP